MRGQETTRLPPACVHNKTLFLWNFSVFGRKTRNELAYVIYSRSRQGAAKRFSQNHGVIHLRWLCSNGHQRTLSVVSDWWRCNARQCRARNRTSKGNLAGAVQDGVQDSNCIHLQLIQKSGNDHILLRGIIYWPYDSCWLEQSSSRRLRLLQIPKIVDGPGLHVRIDETLISRR